MATIAALLDRLAVIKGVDAVASPARNQQDPYELRPLPNEDIFLYKKHIDNSQVVRQADPQAWRVGWKMIAASVAGSAAVIGFMLPILDGAFYGYKVEALKQERARLVNERTTLDLAEARMLNPQHLQELARKQSFVDPDPQKVVFLEMRQETTVAGRTDPPAADAAGRR